MKLTIQEIKAYMEQRISEMPLVELAQSEDGASVLADVAKVVEKYYNGVYIETAESMAKILGEEYGAEVTPCHDAAGEGNYIKVSCDAAMDVVKKKMNRIEAFVSSI